MQTKTVCRFARIPRTVCLIALSAVIFTGILVLMNISKTPTTSNAINTAVRIYTHNRKGSIFVSDLSGTYDAVFSERKSLSSGLG